MMTQDSPFRFPQRDPFPEDLEGLRGLRERLQARRLRDFGRGGIRSEERLRAALGRRLGEQYLSRGVAWFQVGRGSWQRTTVMGPLRGASTSNV